MRWAGGAVQTAGRYDGVGGSSQHLLTHMPLQLGVNARTTQGQRKDIHKDIRKEIHKETHKEITDNETTKRKMNDEEYADSNGRLCVGYDSDSTDEEWHNMSDSETMDEDEVGWLSSSGTMTESEDKEEVRKERERRERHEAFMEEMDRLPV